MKGTVDKLLNFMKLSDDEEYDEEYEEYEDDGGRRGRTKKVLSPSLRRKSLK